jgi:pimeloyl-ACP methyl ester carboxylesterase
VHVMKMYCEVHGRTADIPRDITNENLADDVAVAMQTAIRHPDKVRRAVIVSARFRRDGLIAEAQEHIPKLTADDYPKFVRRVIGTALQDYDFGAEKLKATKAPMLFIHGDADGVGLEHVAGKCTAIRSRARHRDWRFCPILRT